MTHKLIRKIAGVPDDTPDDAEAAGFIPISVDRLKNILWICGLLLTASTSLAAILAAPKHIASLEATTNALAVKFSIHETVQGEQYRAMSEDIRNMKNDLRDLTNALLGDRRRK